jgi:hypothetical protein
MTATAPRPRTGFLHRLHCARNGHYWERQLADDGEGARWVCVRCGKHGDGVPLVARTTPYHAARAADRPVPQADIEDEYVEDDSADRAASEEQPAGWATSWMGDMSDDRVEDIVHAADAARAQAGPDEEPQPAPHHERTQTALTPTAVAVAVVSLAVVGGAAYLAFRRRRRNR